MRAARSRSPSARRTSAASARCRVSSRRLTTTRAKLGFPMLGNPPGVPGLTTDARDAAQPAWRAAQGRTQDRSGLTRRDSFNHDAQSSRPLLVELLTEELPPKASRASATHSPKVSRNASRRDLIEGELVFERYATPRRLAVVVQNVRAVAPEKQVREKVLPGRSRTPTDAAREARGARPRTCRSPISSARRTARPKRSSSTIRQPARRSPTACRPRSTKRSRSCRSRR